MNPLQESWDRIAAHLSAAMDQSDLDPATHGVVTEHLDRNELGLAFDLLVDAYQPTADAAPAAVWSSLRAALEEMQIGPDDPVHGASAREVLSH